MSDENKNNQDILEQLKLSFSADNNNAESIEDNDNDNLSGDDLQAELRSRFLNDTAKSMESQNEEYVIDEDFLQDAVEEDEIDEYEEPEEELDEFDEDEEFDDLDELDEFDDVDELDNDEIYETDETEEFSEENIEEDDYGFYKDVQEGDKEDASEESLEEEAPYDKEASLYEGIEVLREGSQEGDQDNQEIPIYEGMEEIQEEEYNQADEEIYEAEEDQEIQEDDYQSVPLIIDDDNDLFDDDEEIEQEELYDTDEFNGEGEEKSDAERSEDNYLGMFYREVDPYENVPFKDRIVENAPTVDSLEATLNSYSNDPEDFTLEEFDEAESIPLVLEDDDETEEFFEPDEEETQSFADTSELDRSDLALLLEFGYKEELLQKVSKRSLTRSL